MVGCLSFSVQNDAEFDIRRLCPHSSAESFSVLTENPVLRVGHLSMIFDITNSLEGNFNSIFNLHKCDVAT